MANGTCGNKHIMASENIYWTMLLMNCIIIPILIFIAAYYAILCAIKGKIQNKLSHPSIVFFTHELGVDFLVLFEHVCAVGDTLRITF